MKHFRKRVLISMLGIAFGLIRLSYCGELCIDYGLRRVRDMGQANPIVGAIVNPLADINWFSMMAVHAALEQMDEVRRIGEGGRPITYDDIAFMFKLSAEANIVDFNTPDMVALRTNLYEAGKTIRKQLQIGGQKTLSVNLGGEYFLRSFYETYIASGEKRTLSIFPDNNGQGMVTLKLSDVCLQTNPNLSIYFVPKHGQHTNDLSFDDTLAYIEYDLNLDQTQAKRLLTTLAPDSESGDTELGVMDADGEIYRLRIQDVGGKKKLVKDANPLNKGESRPRFIILEDGPQVQGLNPAQLSVTVVEAIKASDAIITEGQAFAEIRGWRKPVYLSFMMKGRAAMAIHGEDKDLKLTALASILPGSIHYYRVEDQMSIYYTDPVTGETFGVAAMPTREFMEVIFSRQWQVLKARYGSEDNAITHIVEKASAEEKSFRAIVLEEVGVTELTLEYPEFILSQYQDPLLKEQHTRLSTLAKALASIAGATLLQQRCVWEAAATLGIETDTVVNPATGEAHWIETNVRKTKECRLIPNEDQIPKYFSLEIQFLSRILRIVKIIEAGISAMRAGTKSEKDIAQEVIKGGEGNIYSRLVKLFISDGVFVPEIRGFLAGGQI